MRCRTLFGIVACVIAGSTAHAQDAHVTLEDLPLRVMTDQYERWTGKRVEIVSGVSAKLSFPVGSPLTTNEAVRLVETELKEHNICLHTIASNRVIAAWIKPPESLSDRLKKRRALLIPKKPHLSGDKLKKHLEKYQMDLIRKGMPALPMPLTKEMEDQLVKEGIRPPAKTSELESSNKTNGE